MITSFTRALLLAGLGSLCLGADGTLDTTFAAAGIVNDGSGFMANACAVQSDGKIVIVGALGNDTEVERRLSTGALDAGFGTGGRLAVSNAPGGTFQESAFGVTLQSDGKILVSGYAFAGTDRDAIVFRLTSAGALDATFGTGGVYRLHSSGVVLVADNAAVQADGKIIFVGRSGSGGFISRLSAGGALDATYGLSPIASVEEAWDVVVQPTDGFAAVVGGSAASGKLVVARFNTTGAADPTFGSLGVVSITTTGVASSGDAYRLALDNAGSIYAATGSTGVTSTFTVAKMSNLGIVDSSYGTTAAAVATSTGLRMEALALQNDGKLLIGGAQASNIAAVRLTSTGSADPAFGTSGLASISIGAPSGANAMALDATGRVILAGTGEVAVRLTGSTAPVFPPGGTAGSTATSGSGSGTATGGVSVPSSSSKGGCGLGSGLAAVLVALCIALRFASWKRTSAK